MSSVLLLPSGRFRAFARVKEMKEAQTFDRNTDAESWASKVEERMRDGKWKKRVAAVVKAQKTLTVEQAFADYRDSSDWTVKADTTKKVELGKQKAIVAAMGQRLLVDVTRDDVKAFLKVRAKTHPSRNSDPAATLSNTQLRLELAALSSMCNYGVEQKWIEDNPVRGVRRPVGNRRTGRLDDDLIGKIMNHMAIAADDVAYTFFRILFTSACRPGELAGARKSWLREDPPQIHVPRTKNEDARSIILPLKNYKMLVQHLKQQDPECPFLFGTRKLSKAKPGWSPYNYAVPWKKVAKDLEFKGTGVVPYLARHEAISKLFERTKLSDGQIAGITGHRSAQALWHYKHLRNEHQRPTVNAMDKVVEDAISRGASHLHPSKKLRVGQQLKPRSKPPR